MAAQISRATTTAIRSATAQEELAARDRNVLCNVHPPIHLPSDDERAQDDSDVLTWLSECAEKGLRHQSQHEVRVVVLDMLQCRLSPLGIQTQLH